MEMFLRRKLGKAMSERPSCPGDGCGLNIGVVHEAVIEH
jgi:hypothetical protein